jgi:hypothetical protein
MIAAEWSEKPAVSHNKAVAAEASSGDNPGLSKSPPID